MTVKEHLIEDYAEEDISSGKSYRLLDKICKAEKELVEKLTEDQLDLFKAFRELDDKKFADDIDQALIYGFDYAVKVIKELKEL